MNDSMKDETTVAAAERIERVDTTKTNVTLVGECKSTGNHFNVWQTLGMNFSITATPVSVGAYLSLVNGLGGFPFFFWCYLFGGFFQMVLGLVLAELASAMPHSSGPAHWIRVLGPSRYARFLEHIIGWLTVALWWFTTCGVPLYVGQWTMGFAEALNPGWQAAQWQVYLITFACAALMTVVNMPGLFRVVPHLMTAGIVLINISWIVILVALVVRATPKSSAASVFLEVVNVTGWPDGAVFFLAILPSCLSVGGFDSVTHITDEVPNPDKYIPIVIIGAGLLNFVSGLAMIIVYGFCTVNPEGLLSPYGYQPLINVLKDGLRSHALFCITTSSIIVCVFIAGVAAMTSWNRLYWSFSRGNGLPFSKHTARLTSKDSIPANALVVNFFLVVGLNAASIGSLTALNAILGSAVACSLITYFLVLSLAIFRGRQRLNPSRWLNLGRLGTPLQCVAACWCVFATVWLCFPLYLPITLEFMNWSSVIIVGVLLLASGYYLLFRNQIRSHDYYD